MAIKAYVAVEDREGKAFELLKNNLIPIQRDVPASPFGYVTVLSNPGLQHGYYDTKMLLVQCSVDAI